MTPQAISGFRFSVSALILIAFASGCAPRPTASTATSVPSGTSADTASVASASPEATVAPEMAMGTLAPEPAASTDVLYQDDFTNPATGWPEAKFDNYFIGYHEPEFYHIEIDGPNFRVPVFVPGKKIFGDATIEVKAQISSAKTGVKGDFLYGIAFRRSGDQYYAFVISPRSQKWMLLKSSPSALTTLAQGADTSLHTANADDLLQVDAKGSTFSLHVNDRLVAEVSDGDYANGEVGLYVQTFDSPQTHIHFDQINIRKYKAPQPAQPQTTVLFHDDFTNPSSGWPEAKFDNYFIGYHEPEFYHFEVDNPNYRAQVFLPGKKIIDDATIQLKVQISSAKTAAKGDFLYGIAFRRSGDQYYAFVISPRSQKWMLLKSSPSALTALAQGTDTSLHTADADDLLRLDVHGSTFSLHVNDRLVAEVSDGDYANGEVGFYVQTLDVLQAHVHFDELTISDFEAPTLCKVVSTGTGLNLRKGPGSSSPFIISIPGGEVLEPLGHSLDGQWLKVRVEASGQGGWVNSSDRFVSCNTDIDRLPIVVP